MSSNTHREARDEIFPTRLSAPAAPNKNEGQENGARFSAQTYQRERPETNHQSGAQIHNELEQFALRLHRAEKNAEQKAAEDAARHARSRDNLRVAFNSMHKQVCEAKETATQAKETATEAKETATEALQRTDRHTQLALLQEQEHTRLRGEHDKLSAVVHKKADAEYVAQLARAVEDLRVGRTALAAPSSPRAFAELREPTPEVAKPTDAGEDLRVGRTALAAPSSPRAFAELRKPTPEVPRFARVVEQVREEKKRSALNELD